MNADDESSKRSPTRVMIPVADVGAVSRPIPTTAEQAPAATCQVSDSMARAAAASGTITADSWLIKAALDIEVYLKPRSCSMLEQNTRTPSLIPGRVIDFLDGSARILPSSSTTPGANMAVEIVRRKPLNTTGETDAGREYRSLAQMRNVDQTSGTRHRRKRLERRMDNGPSVRKVCAGETGDGVPTGGMTGGVTSVDDRLCR